MANSLAWVSALWTPIRFTNLVFWLRASNEAGSDGTLLGTLTDLSGNGHNFTQATGANKPILKLNQINGQSAYYFDGARIASCAAFVFGGLKFSVYTVVKYAATAETVVLERSTNTNAVDTGLDSGINTATKEQLYYHEATAGYSEFLTTSNVDTTNFHRVISTGNKSVSTNQTNITYDGSSSGTRPNNQNCNVAMTDSQAFFFGARSGISLPLNGYVAEVAVTSTISASDDTNWTNYVSAQYGV